MCMKCQTPPPMFGWNDATGYKECSLICWLIGDWWLEWSITTFSWLLRCSWPSSVARSSLSSLSTGSSALFTSVSSFLLMSSTPITHSARCFSSRATCRPYNDSNVIHTVSSSQQNLQSKHINWSFAMSIYRYDNNNRKPSRYKLSLFWWQCFF